MSVDQMIFDQKTWNPIGGLINKPISTKILHFEFFFLFDKESYKRLYEYFIFDCLKDF